MPYIEIVEPEDATDELKDIYRTLASSRGKIAEVHKIQSLNPPTIPAHMELYTRIMFSRSPLSRAERELIGVIVSRTNRCVYCVQHHLEALAHFTGQERASELARDGVAASGLSSREALLCGYAEALTTKPQAFGDSWSKRMKEQGLSDREILDTTLVVGYFNFVNRMVIGLGVELEDDPGGYSYD